MILNKWTRDSNKNTIRLAKDVLSRYFLDFTKTIIPLALMGSESIAHSAFGLMGYWLIAHLGSRNNC